MEALNVGRKITSGNITEKNIRLISDGSLLHIIVDGRCDVQEDDTGARLPFYELVNIDMVRSFLASFS